MWFVALDLVLFAVGELYALILDDANTDRGEGLVLGEPIRAVIESFRPAAGPCSTRSR